MRFNVIVPAEVIGLTATTKAAMSVLRPTLVTVPALLLNGRAEIGAFLTVLSVSSLKMIESVDTGVAVPAVRIMLSVPM